MIVFFSCFSLKAKTDTLSTVSPLRLACVGGITTAGFVYGHALQNNLWWKGIVEWSKIGSKHNMNLFGVPTSTIPDENIILSILNDSFILLRNAASDSPLQVLSKCSAIAI